MSYGVYWYKKYIITALHCIDMNLHFDHNEIPW